MIRLGLGLAAGLGLAVAGARLGLALVPPEREALNLVSVGSDTSALWARWSVGDTGFYRDQLTVRLGFVPQDGRTLVHRGMHGPQVLADRGVDAGADRLWRGDGAWEAAIGTPELQLRARIEGAAPACPPAVGALRGNLQAGPEGALLTGPAVLTRTVARGPVYDDALYVLGPGFAAGVDPLSDCPAWVVAGDLAWTGAAPALPEERRGEVRLGDWTLRVMNVGDPLLLETDTHLLPFERWAAAVAGWSFPVQRLWRVAVRVDGPGGEGPRTGLRLDRGVR